MSRFVHENFLSFFINLALGQVMLYVDGMNGVIEDNPTIQWLYSLLTSRFRLVVKTALKLLLVFIEYVESNCLIFIQAVLAVHQSNGIHFISSTPQCPIACVMFVF